MKKERPAIYVSEEIHKEIKVLAAQKEVSIKALVEELLDEELTRLREEEKRNDKNNNQQKPSRRS